ncbi:MAG TPA: autotransporter-associated beta strand repeat-containing protein, partial [Kiritimatiellia bacterium]|nr:autotransporter-associated beta strand repeat-containing protein [Kiritimatiellia bacterium]
PGGLSKTGANIAVLTGDNTYEGVTAINNGIVRITHARALGSPLAGTTMVSPNRLELAGNITVTGETVTVVGKGGNNNGALQVQAGSNTWAGSIIIGSSDARFGVLPSNGTLVLDGPISDGGNGWPLIVRCADAGGPVVVTGTNNTYGGETQVVVGTVKAGGDNRFPTGTVIRVGNSSNVAYATFDVNGFDQTVKGIAAEGTIMACRITNTRTNQAVLTVNNATPYTFAGTLEGSLSLTKAGAARLTLTAASNTYAGVTTVKEGSLRVSDAQALGTVAGGTVVESGAELSLTHGLTVSGESVTISGNGIVAEPPPPSAPNTNRGALQSAANATAEWAGPVLLGANQARVGAQSQGHLIISGVIDDGAATYALRTSSDPNSRTRGVELREQNTYGGSTDLTRGTLFLGVDDALPTGSVLDVHWAGSNNGEYAGLDMAGFDQTVSALRNSGISGNAAAITNSGLTLSTLTLNQTVDTVYAGTIGGAVSVVKAGGGRLTLAHPTHHTGATAIQDGTLELGANNVLSGQSAVVLSGGQLALGATTNTLASLTVTADSTLDLGEGQAVFAAQTPDVWEGTLTLTGMFTPTSVRTQPLLTPAQLAAVRYQGAPVSQNANGYLTEYWGTLFWIE